MSRLFNALTTADAILVSTSADVAVDRPMRERAGDLSCVVAQLAKPFVVAQGAYASPEHNSAVLLCARARQRLLRIEDARHMHARSDC